MDRKEKLMKLVNNSNADVIVPLIDDVVDLLLKPVILTALANYLCSEIIYEQELHRTHEPYQLIRFSILASESCSYRLAYLNEARQ